MQKRRLVWFRLKCPSPFARPDDRVRRGQVPPAVILGVVVFLASVGALYWAVTQSLGPRSEDRSTQDGDFPKVLPELALVKPSGESFVLEISRPTVLVFWAIWCAPCVKELPDILKRVEANPDLDWVFINYDEGRDGKSPALYVEEWLAQQGYTINRLYFDTHQNALSALDVAALPLNVGVRKDRSIGFFRLGESPWADDQFFLQFRRRIF